MKRPIKKLINLLFALMFLCSCNWQSSTGYKANYSKSKLSPNFKGLVEIYIQNHPELKAKSHILELSVLNLNSREYYVRLDNYIKSQNGYDEELTKSWSIYKFERFVVYILDKEEKISETTNNKITINFLKHRDSIIPEMYDGNPWEIQFRNDSIISLNFMEEHVKKEIIRKIDFNNISDSIFGNK